ncbi:hypothetical protein SCLCIDRAFT_1224664 [Scleroderma citrinum Foug A]|uniref:Uncharacterized protein n=1 Tax=Scleroderma citrinum Foug A TaxID=1036808 RepID=A0A0C3D5A5_9AGAM|nr:hypothetical protein SCLCIDRAFT_1224664 [Scleroderma citrinum Foug A]
MHIDPTSIRKHWNKLRDSWAPWVRSGCTKIIPAHRYDTIMQARATSSTSGHSKPN